MGSTMLENLHCLTIVSFLLTSASPAAGGRSGIRLAGAGSTRCSGRVELYYNRTWGTVCDDEWDFDDAEVVCMELGCRTALAAPRSAHFGKGTGPIWLDDVNCSGNERSLTECGHREFGRHNCGHSEDASVVCSDVLMRLVGSTLCSGRVEIYHDNMWGTICDDGWDLKDAKVVCRELGCGKALSVSHFDEGTGKIWLDDVVCLGNERSVTECQHAGFGIHNCGHGEDAGVVCSAILPKPSISMDPAAQVAWGQNVTINCSISVQHLEGRFTLQRTSGSFRKTQTSRTNSAAFSILQVDFDSEGSYQCQYTTEVSSQDFSSTLSDSLRLSVKAPALQQPSISLTSPNGGLVWGPEGAEVTRGYSFVFTCSISSIYPGGVFSLIFSGSSLPNTKLSVEHSASFNFPVADYEHQGNYSCVYEVTLSAQRFTSNVTQMMSVIIKMPSLLLVSSVAAGILLLVLLVLLLVCLVCRRRRRAKQPAVIVQSQLAVRVRNDYGDDSDVDNEDLYQNVNPVDTMKKLKEEAGRMEEEESDTYEEPDKEETISDDDEGLYENVNLRPVDF